MNNNRLAVIDTGTNTFRLLIAELQPAAHHGAVSFREIHSERTITRLGEGVSVSGLISDAAIKRGIDTLKHFSELIRRHDVCRTSAIATSVFREAQNSAGFVRLAREETGIEIETVSGRREAEITAAGMLIDLPPAESSFMIDIGGGSTELIFMKDRNIQKIESLDLGVVHLADKYMINDPPGKEDLRRMEYEITGKINNVSEQFRELLTFNTAFIGTAGTITALAAMSQDLKTFDHERIHKYILTTGAAGNIFALISRLSSTERAEHIPFEPARLDIIVPGTLILLKLMETFEFGEIIVSNYGLLEGALLDLYKKEHGQ
ncbi:MAG: Ppx/GppA phosphatase family protein [Nitrospirota bacterium]